MDIASRADVVEAPYAALIESHATDPSRALVAFAERMPSPEGSRWQPRVVMRDA